MANRGTGIEVRHGRDCPTRRGGDCVCDPSYRATVWDPRDRRTLRESFRSAAAAEGWRIDTLAAVRSGALRADKGPTLKEAAERWERGARSGAVRNRSGDHYKPSVIRGYVQALNARILPELGAVRIGDLRREHVQRLVDDLMTEHEPSTIRNTVMPLRAICRRAIARGEIGTNPTLGLELPAVRGRRKRIAAPTEAVTLVDALERDRALWSTALYAGLRRGELQALRWEDVDLKGRRISVVWSWDREEGQIEPKSEAGERVVPIPSVLYAALKAHRVASPSREGFVFGRAADLVFSPESVSQRAKRAWAKAKLNAIGLHECQHTYASFMIAAGVNAKALCTYMGHASVTITFDRYGHLMPGNEAEAAGLLDGYLERETKAAA